MVQCYRKLEFHSSIFSIYKLNWYNPTWVKAPSVLAVHCLHYTLTVHSHNGFVPSSWALLSVMKNWGDHPGFHSFSFCKLSCIDSSISHSGIIVATNRPIAECSFHDQEEARDPYCSVLYVASMHVMVFPYSSSHLLCCFVEGLRERTGLHLER